MPCDPERLQWIVTPSMLAHPLPFTPTRLGAARKEWLLLRDGFLVARVTHYLLQEPQDRVRSVTR